MTSTTNNCSAVLAQEALYPYLSGHVFTTVVTSRSGACLFCGCFREQHPAHRQGSLESVSEHEARMMPTDTGIPAHQVNPSITVTVTTIAQRVEFSRSVPCFHCSKSLRRLTSGNRQFVGFVLIVDGLERVFHSRCVSSFQSNECPDCGLAECRCGDKYEY